MIGSFDRVPDHRYGESIDRARRRIPVHIRRRLQHVRFLCGVDPVFAGLHSYHQTQDGRSYKQTAHCVYPFHMPRPAADRVTTVVLPEHRLPHVIVHELGHALHEVVGFGHTATPVTEYAQEDRYEAFAEAFTTWLYLDYGDDDVLFSDLPTIALFEELAA